MTMTNAEWMIKNGYKFSDIHYVFSIYHKTFCVYLNGKIVGEVISKSYPEALKKWLDMEHVEPILDGAEKRYLKGVIRPFRDKVQNIAKIDASSYEFIRILLKSEQIVLPFFKKGRMYKGMEIDRAYTLEELGL